MDSSERKFNIDKNTLDNEYNKYMSYIEITAVVIATAIISADAVFLANKDVENIFNASLVGLLIALFFFVYFRNKRIEVQQKIKELEQREI